MLASRLRSISANEPAMLPLGFVLGAVVEDTLMPLSRGLGGAIGLDVAAFGRLGIVGGPGLVPVVILEPKDLEEVVPLMPEDRLTDA